MCGSGQPLYRDPAESSNCTFFSVLLCLIKESDEQTSKLLIHSEPVITCDSVSIGCDKQSGNERSSQLCMSKLTDHGKNKSHIEMKLQVNKPRFDFVSYT